MKKLIYQSKIACVFAIVVAMVLCSCKKDEGTNEIPSSGAEIENNTSDDEQGNKNGDLSQLNGDIVDNKDDNPDVPDIGDEEDGEGKTSTSDSVENNIVQTSTPSTTTASVASRDSALETQWKLLDELANVAQGYYSENFSKTRVITNGGYLYNKSIEQRIDVNQLQAGGYISSKFSNKGIEILLLDAKDLKNYDKFNLGANETSLTVFVSIKHPSENSYLLTSSKGTGGVISASQYAALLNGYYQNHGVFGRLYPGAGEYDRILNFISMYESKYESYYVRSIVTDNKYAMVVLSGQSNTADVKQYILKNSGGVWEVVLSGLESDPRVIITINKEIPNFNLNMIPSYTINDYRSGMSRDKSTIINTMINKGIIENSGDIRYICGTSNYCYVVLNNLQKFVCNNVGDSWNIVQVATSLEAADKMRAISGSAPTFIILDD